MIVMSLNNFILIHLHLLDGIYKFHLVTNMINDLFHKIYRNFFKWDVCNNICKCYLRLLAVPWMIGVGV